MFDSHTVQYCIMIMRKWILPVMTISDFLKSEQICRCQANTLPELSVDLN